jgi:hypothetical protein
MCLPAGSQPGFTTGGTRMATNNFRPALTLAEAMVIHDELRDHVNCVEAQAKQIRLDAEAAREAAGPGMSTPARSQEINALRARATQINDVLRLHF